MSIGRGVGGVGGRRLHPRRFVKIILSFFPEIFRKRGNAKVENLQLNRLPPTPPTSPTTYNQNKNLYIYIYSLSLPPKRKDIKTYIIFNILKTFEGETDFICRDYFTTSWSSVELPHFLPRQPPSVKRHLSTSWHHIRSRYLMPFLNIEIYALLSHKREK